jgi:hypothetical protein
VKMVMGHPINGASQIMNRTGTSAQPSPCGRAKTASAVLGRGGKTPR